MSGEKKQDYNLENLIKEHRLIAILRHLTEDQLEPVLTTLLEAGVYLVEITMNTSAAARKIQQVNRLYGQNILIGAGTVTSPERAQEALAAGANFLVTPNFDPQVVSLAVSHNCPVIPGVLTPSEMVAAAKAGAQIQKLFPAGRMGTGYLQDVLAPLDDLNIVAVGGITPDNAANWLQAGAIGVGIGSSLLPGDLIANREYNKLRQRIADLVLRLKG